MVAETCAGTSVRARKSTSEAVPEGRADEYLYAWRNNERRAKLYGRRCRLIASGRMSTVLVEFLDTGERVTTSRRALRKPGDRDPNLKLPL